MWGVAFSDITKARRKNIMSQLNPNFLTLVDRPERFDPKEFQSLFGRKFSRSLVTLAGNAAIMRNVPSSRRRGGRHNGSFNRRSGNFSGHRGGNQQRNRGGNYNNNGNSQAGSFGNGQRNGNNHGNNNNGHQDGNFQNSNRGGYVMSSFQSNASTVSRSAELIGGRLRMFSRVWCNFTADPWVLSSVSEGVRLELMRTPVQVFQPSNAPMSDVEVM